MSVAFRRESDEEHLEPKFDIPLPPGPNLVTARGLALIQAKVAEFDAALAAAGDDEARKVVKRDLKYWTTRAATAQLAPIPSGEEAAFGCDIRYRLDGTEARVAIVGADEADPTAGRIAFTAPLARALIGAAPGEMVNFNGRADAIEIVAVDPIG
ncbi:MAG: GreA/GreB family elongation factor [Pseudomonadota bacterium]